MPPLLRDTNGWFESNRPLRRGRGKVRSWRNLAVHRGSDEGRLPTRCGFSSVGPAIVNADNLGYKARELPYFGHTIDARAALELSMVNASCKLGKTSLRRTKRLPLISAEALNAAKRAINCGPDAAGFRTALYAGLDIVGLLYAT